MLEGKFYDNIDGATMELLLGLVLANLFYKSDYKHLESVKSCYPVDTWMISFLFLTVNLMLKMKIYI